MVINFVDNIKRLRKQAGVSQGDVAEAIWVVCVTYASLEADMRPPNLDELNEIACNRHDKLSQFIQNQYV